MKGLRTILAALLALSLVSGCSQKAEPTRPGEAAVIAGKLSDGATYEASVKLTGYLNADQVQQLRNYDLYVEEAVVGAVEMEVTMNQLEGREVLDLTQVWEASFQTEETEDEPIYESWAIYPGNWFQGIKPMARQESSRGWILITKSSDPVLMGLAYKDQKEAQKEIQFQIPQPNDSVLSEDAELKIGESFLAGKAELTVEEIKTVNSVLMYRSDSGMSLEDGEQGISLRLKVKNGEDYDLHLLLFSLIYHNEEIEIGGYDLFAEEGETELEVYDSFDPGTEKILRLLIKLDADAASSGRLKLAVNGHCFGMDYTVGDDLDAYPVYQEGNVIETAQDRLTIEKISTVTRLDPPNTAGDYTYMKADPGSQLYVAEGLFENLGSETVKAEERLGILWQENSEFVYGWIMIPEGNDFLQSKTLEPQTRTKVCFVLMLNDDQLQRRDKIRIGVGDEVIKGSAS